MGCGFGIDGFSKIDLELAVSDLGRVCEVPEEFMYNPVSRSYGEPHKRPEVQNATIEFIAPSEYMVVGLSCTVIFSFFFSFNDIFFCPMPPPPPLAEAAAAGRVPLRPGRVSQRSGDGLPESLLSVGAGQHQRVRRRRSAAIPSVSPHGARPILTARFLLRACAPKAPRRRADKSRLHHFRQHHSLLQPPGGTLPASDAHRVGH